MAPGNLGDPGSNAAISGSPASGSPASGSPASRLPASGSPASGLLTSERPELQGDLQGTVPNINHTVYSTTSGGQEDVQGVSVSAPQSLPGCVSIETDMLATWIRELIVKVPCLRANPEVTNTSLTCWIRLHPL